MNVQHLRLNSYYAKILTRLSYFAKMMIYRCSLYPRVLIDRASDFGTLVGAIPVPGGIANGWGKL